MTHWSVTFVNADRTRRTTATIHHVPVMEELDLLGVSSTFDLSVGTD